MATLCVPSSGQRFFIPSTVVTCSAILQNGPSSSCSFTLAIIETTYPTIQCPANLVVQASGGFPKAPVSFTPAITDLQGINTTATYCSPSSGSTFFLFTNTTVTCVATNYAPFSVNCSFNVAVIDTVAPSVYCPGTVNVATSGSQLFGFVNYGSATGSDNGGIAYCNCTIPTNSWFPYGTTVNNCTCTDRANNTSPVCRFNVNIYDCCLPSITQATINTRPMANSLLANVSFTPTCSDGSGIKYYNCTYPSPYLFTQGTTFVNCTDTDAVGKVSNIFTFPVNVVDSTKPNVYCPASITTVPATGTIYATVSFNATANDTSGLVNFITCTPPSGGSFLLGNTTVTCTSTDYAGNVAAPCSFNVQVKSTTPPTITCPSNIVVGPSQGFSYAIVSYTPTATDATIVTSVTCSPVSGSAFALQTVTNVSCFATNYVNLTSSVCRFTVNVSDTTPPIITCPLDIITQPPPGLNSVIVNWAVVATDAGLIRNQSCDHTSGIYYSFGLYTVTCVAYNWVNLTSGPCTFHINIVDTTPPVISCGANTIANTLPGLNTGASVWSAPVATDICNCAITLTCVPPIGTTIFPFGLTTIQCTAIDAFNNIAECSQTVQIFDREVPTIHCPASATANLPLNAASGAVTWTVQSGDNVALASTICSPSSASTFLVGTTPVICTATDTSHTSASCQCNAIMYDVQLQYC